MEDTTLESAAASSKPAFGRKRGRAVVLFGCLAGLWLAVDMATKSFFNGSFAPGDVVTEPIAGLFRFRLVHNTGAAWGMFGDSTFALGVMSVIVCAVLLVYLVVGSKTMNTGQIVGLAVVFAGGIGNAIDRFTLGYVVDFIDFTFIDFPVFNVADIGVTCGFVIFIASMLYAWKQADDQAAARAAEGSEGLDGEAAAVSGIEASARVDADVPSADAAAEAAVDALSGDASTGKSGPNGTYADAVSDEAGPDARAEAAHDIPPAANGSR